MPEAFKSEIKITLDGIKEKWEKGFIKLAAKKNKTIIQPVFLFIDNDCLIDSSLLGKLRLKDSLHVETTRGSILKNATMRFLSTNIINIQKTYLEALDFGTGSVSYIDCIF